MSLESQKLARRLLQEDLQDLGRQVIEANARVWPQGVDCHYLVIHHKGHTKVRFMPPDVKQQGWKD